MSIYHLIVDKYHVSTSDVEVMKRVIESRPKKAWAKASPGDRTTFLLLCLDAHHENQALYRAVMRGM